MSDILNTDIKYLPGIGPKRGALLLSELGIGTFGDLLYFFPFRYIDRTKVYAVNELAPTMAYVQVRGRLSSISIVGNTPKNKRLSAFLTDSTGSIELIFFKGLKWIQERLKVGNEYIAFGRLSDFNGKVNMVHPEVNSVAEEHISGVGNIVGVYSSTEKIKNNGIGNKSFTKYLSIILERHISQIEETLPLYLRERKGLISLQEALVNIHFPKSNTALELAQARLKYEELFYLQLSLLKQKSVRIRGASSIIMHKVGRAFNGCYNSLPFPLTSAQKRVIREIREDMRSGRQMNRLLQGDVGSGKTLVALLSALIAVDNGYQACIMAPTEVLAQQHFKGISKFLKGQDVKVALLTGTTKKSERKVLHSELLSGEIDILIGTHALIEDSVAFANLGFAVIDEQHRFGVEQRSKLWSKSEVPPHILVMTATPIPRTLAMTLYGDLDLSVIDELPPGRKPIVTLHITENRRRELFDFMREQIRVGRQVFVVYPLIKESEKMDYKNLEDGYKIITEEFKAPEYVTAVVHGKQRAEDKACDMNLFAEGKAHILVATSVIEVGVDVPNASVMVIESAERFGLSQLHQLRGRVGRGSEKSFCILMTGYKLSKESRQRIELMCRSQDGFELAEEDLRMRGPGDLEGTAQSGLAVDLHIASLSRDSKILEDARVTAQGILDVDPLLEAPENRILKERLQRLRMNGGEPVDYSQIS